MLALSLLEWVLSLAVAVLAAIVGVHYQRRFTAKDEAADAVKQLLRRLDGISKAVDYSMTNPKDEHGLKNAEHYIGEARPEVEPVRRARDAATVAYADSAVEAFADVVRALRGGDLARAAAELEKAESEHDAFVQAVR